MTEFLAPLTSVDGLISLFTLVVLEIVLGVDNIIFIAIICGYLRLKKDQHRARVIGLSLALVIRILLLMAISWIARLVTPLFFIGDFGASGRDVILFGGGVFLIVKTIKEIIQKFKLADHEAGARPTHLTMSQAILQITLIDIVFSFDSIITAVGLSNQLVVMILAVTIAMFVMIWFAPYVSDFINKYPTIKMLALTFLVAIGIILVLESSHLHVNKTYIYVAMAFSVVVELLNIRLRNISMSKVKRS
jgi:predicted tellurium resistance membrane protein TerC